MKTIKHILLVILLLLIWASFVGYGFIDGFLLRALTSDKSPKAFIEAAKNSFESDYVGNLAMTLIEDGEVAETFFYAHNNENINQSSAFPVASISKWVTSVAIMKLVERGQINLDKPVDNYLSRWHLPPSEYDNIKVTVRRLLSHSAGLVDDLGYSGFPEGEQVQTLEESLTKAADGPYSEGIARVGYDPGSQYMYSGASYALLQLLIEEVSGKDFQEFMMSEVFEPLGMENSSFVLNDSSKIGLVSVYRNDGTKRPMNRFTAKAAASLMTSVADLSKFMIAFVSKNEVLTSETIQLMSEAQSFRNGIGYYGLGPNLYSQNGTNSKIIGHDGSGNNAINTAARIDLISKDGVIVLETGHYSIASSLADEWIYWKAGIADRVVMERNMSFILTLLVIGSLIIITISVIVIRKKNRRQAG